MIPKLLALDAVAVVVFAQLLTADWTALATAIAILVAAIGVVAVNLYIARTSRLVQLAATKALIEPVEAKIDALKPVVEKIDTHVNGEKSRAESERAMLKQQNQLQAEIIERMDKAAALLAQAKATVDVSSAVALAAVAGATNPGPAVTPPVPSTGQ